MCARLTGRLVPSTPAELQVCVESMDVVYDGLVDERVVRT